MNRRGFSLIELGIALGVVAVLAVLIISARGFMEAARQSNAVQLVSTLFSDSLQWAKRQCNGVAFQCPAGGSVSLAALYPPARQPQTPWGSSQVAVNPVDGTVGGADCRGFTCLRVCMAVAPTECNQTRELLVGIPSGQRVQGVIEAQCSSAGGVNNCSLGGSVLSVLMR